MKIKMSLFTTQSQLKQSIKQQTSFLLLTSSLKCGKDVKTFTDYIG